MGRKTILYRWKVCAVSFFDEWSVKNFVIFYYSLSGDARKIKEKNLPGQVKNQ